MDLQKSCRRLAAWVLTLALAAALALPGGAVYAMPIQTANAQESIYLINAVTGEVLLDQNSGQQRCVASLPYCSALYPSVCNHTKCNEIVRLSRWTFSRNLKA